MKNNMILKQISKVEIFFLIGLVCIMSLTGCDNSTAQQKNKTLTKNEKTKQDKSSELLAPDFSLADLEGNTVTLDQMRGCLLYTSPSPRDGLLTRMPSSA